MNGSITHEYQLVAAGVLPLWGGVLLALVVTGLIVWLVRGEIRSRKRAGGLITLLLANRAGLSVLLAVLLVQPVLYISRIVTQPGQLILAADRSRSMLRVDAMDATTQLNFAAMLKTPGLESRLAAGDEARRLLSSRRAQMAQFRAQAAAAAADLSQGIPPSAAVGAQLSAQAPEVASLARDLQALLSALAKAAPAAATQPAQDPMALADKAATDLSDLGAALAAAAGKTLTQESAEALLRAYDQAAKSIEAADPALAAVQLQLDQKFLASLPADARKPVDALAQKTRFELAQIVASRAAADPQLAAAHRVILRGFDPLTPAAAEAHTDLYDVIDQSTRQDVDEVVSGLVLLSDGQQNLPERAEVLRRLPGRGIPFLAAGVGSSDAVADVAVVDVDVPLVIQRDKKVTLTAQLKTQVPADAPITVTLSGADDQAIARARATPGPKGRGVVAMEFKLGEAGTQVLKLTASLDKPDAAPENDSVSIPVTVIGQPARVLVIARWPRWDLVHMIQALSGRPTRVDTVFWGQLPKAPARGSATGSIPDSLESLKRYQLVILDGALFTEARADDAQLFSDFVTQGAGNLLVVNSESGGYADTWKWIGSAAPAAGATSRPAVGSAAALSPGPKVDGLPLTLLSSDPALSRSAWSTLAPVVVQSPVSPQAVELLNNAAGEPVMSLGFRGRGKVYLLGVSDLFRTREWAGGPAANRFLGALLDDALLPLYPSPDARAAIYPAVPVAGAASFVVAPKAESVQFKPAGGAASPIALTPPSDSVPAAMATHMFSSVGKFELLIGDAPAVASQAVRQTSMEDVDFQLDPAKLTTLATAAGGRYVPLLELPAALKQVPAATERTVTVRQIELWNLLALLPLIAAMMTLDWFLRRKSGMVL